MLVSYVPVDIILVLGLHITVGTLIPEFLGTTVLHMTCKIVPRRKSTPARVTEESGFKESGSPLIPSLHCNTKSQRKR